MNKKIFILIAILVAIAIIVGVVILSNQNKNIQINIEELSEKILESGVFTDELSKVENEIVIRDYSFKSEEIKEIVSYQGSGATSEELVILQVNDKSYLNSVKNKVNTRLEERKEAFESYLPEEVFKIDNNLLEIKGNYLILCISNNSSEVSKIIVSEIKK